MIVVKEEGGTLYVADIGPAKSQYTPGDLTKPWTPVGPGLKPTVTTTGSKFYVAFDYMGHTYVREMDSAVWPPEVIDPTTYTPNISLTEPQDALGLGNGDSTSMGGMVLDSGWDLRPIPNTLERVTPNIIYDVNTKQGSIDIQRKLAVAVPDPVLFSGWRVYHRTPALGDTGAGPWELLFDWQTEVTKFTLIRDMASEAFRDELALVFGYLWRPDTQNMDPEAYGNHLESAKGPTLVIDSVVEPKTLQMGLTEAIGAAVGDSSPAFVLPGDPQVFYSKTGEDVIPAFITGPLQLSGGTTLEAWSSVFVAVECAIPGGLADFVTLSQGISPAQVILYT